MKSFLDSFTTQESRSAKTPFDLELKASVLLSASIGLIVIALIVGFLVAALLLVHPAEDNRRLAFQSSITRWNSIPEIEQQLLSPPEIGNGRGYLRGKCVLVAYNPLRRDGQLHPWHPMDDTTDLFADTPDEVETLVWLVKTEEFASESKRESPYSRTTEVLTVYVIDLIERELVGHWSMKGQTQRSTTEQEELWALSSKQLLSAIQQLPVQATIEHAQVPTHSGRTAPAVDPFRS